MLTDTALTCRSNALYFSIIKKPFYQEVSTCWTVAVVVKLWCIARIHIVDSLSCHLYESFHGGEGGRGFVHFKIGKIPANMQDGFSTTMI